MSRRTAQPYKRHRFTGEYDAIVVGSGIGGLASAAMLAKHGGKRVLVLERHYTPGGYTHVFHRPGYDWDVGVHYVGGMEPGTTLRRMFITTARIGMDAAALKACPQAGGLYMVDLPLRGIAGGTYKR